MAQKDRDHIRRLREEANAIRKQEQAKRRRNKILAQVGTIVGAIVVIGAIVGLVVWGPQWFNPRPPFEAASTVSVTSSATGEAREVPISTTERGGIMVGEADAPVTFDYWYDYSCPHCVEYHAAVGQSYLDLIATGQVRVEYLPINYVAPYGAQAGAAVLSVVQQQPELYFTVSDGLFAIPAQTQSSWTGPDYAAIMSTFGVTNEQAITDISDGTYLRIITDATRDARSGGVNGTPSIGVNGTLLDTIPTADELYTIATDNGAAVTAPTIPADATEGATS